MMKNISIAAVAFILMLASCQKESVELKTDGGDGGGVPPTIVYNVDKASLLKLVNDVRQKGCNCGSTAMPAVPVLSWNDQLAKASYDHSKDMFTQSYFSHTGLNGSTPGQRITAAGYTWKTFGENIASGYSTEQQVFNAWLNSEGHCKNIMGANFKDMGAGREGNIWTQVFGAK